MSPRVLVSSTVLFFSVTTSRDKRLVGVQKLLSDSPNFTDTLLPIETLSPTSIPCHPSRQSRSGVNTQIFTAEKLPSNLLKYLNFILKYLSPDSFQNQLTLSPTSSRTLFQVVYVFAHFRHPAFRNPCHPIFQLPCHPKARLTLNRQVCDCNSVRKLTSCITSRVSATIGPIATCHPTFMIFIPVTLFPVLYPCHPNLCRPLPARL